MRRMSQIRQSFGGIGVLRFCPDRSRNCTLKWASMLHTYKCGFRPNTRNQGQSNRPLPSLTHGFGPADMWVIQVQQNQ